MILALAGSGLAHRAPVAADVQLAAWIASGGSLADLCGGFGHDVSDDTGCPYCRLVGAAVLPPPVTGPVWRFASTTTLTLRPHVTLPPALWRDRAGAPRAPPAA